MQSGTIQIWGVQLEVGTAMTPLEKIGPVDEVSQCQRYLELGAAMAHGNASIATQAIYGNINFNVAKRVTPAIFLGTLNYANANNATAQFTSAAGWILAANSIAAGYASAWTTPWRATAEL